MRGNAPREVNLCVTHCKICSSGLMTTIKYTIRRSVVVVRRRCIVPCSLASPVRRTNLTYETKTPRGRTRAPSDAPKNRKTPWYLCENLASDALTSSETYETMHRLCTDYAHCLTLYVCSTSSTVDTWIRWSLGIILCWKVQPARRASSATTTSQSPRRLISKLI